MKRGRGRPSVWRREILDFVKDRGIVTIREIRVALGMPESSAFHAVNGLAMAGELDIEVSEKRHCRLVKRTKKEPASLDFLTRLGY